MQVISVDEIFEGRQSSQDQLWKRTYTRIFRVVTDDPHVGSGAVRAAVPVAIGMKYSTGYETDFGAYCQKITATQESVGDGKSWLVTCEYGPYDSTQWPENPLDRQPEISWEYQQYQEVASEDINGDSIVNSAGDPFDPPIMKDFSRPILTLVRNESNFDPLLAYNNRDKVNSNSFFGADAGQVKCQSITPRRVFNQDIGWYWTVTYQFIFNDKGWKPQIYDMGFRQLDPSDDTKRIEITDEHGQRISSPWPLDENGQPLAPGDKPATIEFEIYESIDFSVFNFDSFYEALQNYQAGA